MEWVIDLYCLKKKIQWKHMAEGVC